MHVATPSIRIAGTTGAYGAAAKTAPAAGRAAATAGAWHVGIPSRAVSARSCALGVPAVQALKNTTTTAAAAALASTRGSAGRALPAAGAAYGGLAAYRFGTPTRAVTAVGMLAADASAAARRASLVSAGATAAMDARSTAATTRAAIGRCTLAPVAAGEAGKRQALTATLDGVAVVLHTSTITVTRGLMAGRDRPGPTADAAVRLGPDVHAASRGGPSAAGRLRAGSSMGGS